MSKRLIAFTHGDNDPSGRFRIAQYLPYLGQAGWEVSLRPRRPSQPWNTPFRNPLLQFAYRRSGLFIRRINRLRDIHNASAFDVVFLNRDLLEGKFQYEQRLFNKNPHVIFDFDDAIFLGHKEKHIGQICEKAAWVIAGNEYLASFARKYSSRVRVIPTVIDTSLYPLVSEARPGKTQRIRLGWLGSAHSIEQTLFPYIAMFSTLQYELGFEFNIVTHPRPVLPKHGLRWNYVEWSPAVETNLGNHMDIGIMPLVDNEFQRGKCGCKLLQYMSASLPFVASPVGINTELTGHGARGLTASTPKEWTMAIRSLMSNAEQRLAMGQSGRAFVEEHYSVRRWFPELLSIIERA